MCAVLLVYDLWWVRASPQFLITTPSLTLCPAILQFLPEE